MGIENLNKFLKCVPRAFMQFELNDFATHRLAIDGNCVAYRLMSRAITRLVAKKNVPVPLARLTLQEEWLKICADYMITLLKADITPVLVIDGVAPAAKDRTRKKREEKATKAQATLQLAIDGLDGSAHSREVYGKAMSNAVFVDRSEIELMFELMQEAGIPSFRAPSEGEKFCSALCIEGLVTAIVTTDTDPMAMGCPLIINKIEGRKVECVSTQVVLEDLGCTQDFFTDLCIMGGCDFNENVPNIRLTRAYPLLLKAGCIEGLRLPDTSMLNTNECRELFEYEPSNVEDQELALQSCTSCDANAMRIAEFVASCQPGRAGSFQW